MFSILIFYEFHFKWVSFTNAEAGGTREVRLWQKWGDCSKLLPETTEEDQEDKVTTSCDKLAAANQTSVLAAVTTALTALDGISP